MDLPDEIAFVNAIVANPYDRTILLVYADYLQENGDDLRSEYLRYRGQRRPLTRQERIRMDELQHQCPVQWLNQLSLPYATRNRTIEQSMDSTSMARAMWDSHALIYLSVNWSDPERTSRSLFFRAGVPLLGLYPVLELSCYIFDEEREDCRMWLESLGHVELARAAHEGRGPVVWLEYGELIDWIPSSLPLGPEGIIRRTLTLWSDPD